MALALATNDIICVDSEGDTEATPVVLSDTDDDDIVFVGHINHGKVAMSNDPPTITTSNAAIDPLVLQPTGQDDLVLRADSTTDTSLLDTPVLPDVPDFLNDLLSATKCEPPLACLDVTANADPLFSAVLPSSHHQTDDDTSTTVCNSDIGDESTVCNSDNDEGSTVCNSDDSDGPFSTRPPSPASSISSSSSSRSQPASPSSHVPDSSTDENSSDHSQVSSSSSSSRINSSSPVPSPHQPSNSTANALGCAMKIATPMFDRLIHFPEPATSIKDQTQPNNAKDCAMDKNYQDLFQTVIAKPGSSSSNDPKPTSPDTTNKLVLQPLSIRPKLSKSRRISDVQVPPKKRKLHVEADIVISDDSDSESGNLLDSVIRRTTFVDKHDECSRCDKMVLHKDILYCQCGQTCCTQCLHKQITDLLAKGEKGVPKCTFTDCGQTMDMAKLAEFLPPIVMTILKKKVEEEEIGDIKDWLRPLTDADAGSLCDAITAAVAPVPERKDIERVMDLPDYWTPMHEYQDFLTVTLSPDEKEYIDVHNQFHHTMHNPRAQISSIKRVQNPTLWRFYAMRRHKMYQDLVTVAVSRMEQQLFHGTRKEHVDAICRDNFDWRLCGTHGTAYGNGSYFARDASYSHRYTDPPPGLRRIPGGAIQPWRPIVRSMASAQPSAMSLMFPMNLSRNTTSHGISSILGSQPPPPPLPYLPGTSTATYIQPPPNLPSIPVPTSTYPWAQLLTNKDPLMNQPGEQQRPEHTHVMFLARVLTGQFTLGKHGYRKPPPVDQNCKNAKCYDSCVNCLQNPTIFVVFEKSQCYPDYIVEYTNLPNPALQNL